MKDENWADSPEERITREEFRASKGGLQSKQFGEDGGEAKGVGRFLERVVIRELQKIAYEDEAVIETETIRNCFRKFALRPA